MTVRMPLAMAETVGMSQTPFRPKTGVRRNRRAKTRRPIYANLSSAIRYNSRHIWQIGNAGLQPELESDWAVFIYLIKFV